MIIQTGNRKATSPFFIYMKKSMFLLGLLFFYAGAALAQPANDDPCNAITVTPAASCSFTTYTNAGATASAGVPAPGCANYLGGDVWFKVTVPAGGGLTFDTQTGVITDGGMAIYSGTCTNLTLLACDDDASTNGAMPKITLGGLTPGNTLWISVWEYGNNNNGTFGLCVTFPPPPPSNDNPCTATPVTAGQTCNYTTYTNAGATASTGVPAPGCANYSGGDVWFSVVVPCGGALSFDTQTGGLTDAGMAIYSGTCSNLTLITCDDDGSANGAMPYITRNNLVPGSTIWIRVWDYGNNDEGTFGLCVSIPPPPGPGGSCSSALPFCTSNQYVFPNNTNQPSLGGGGIYGCLSTTPNPVWYYMQIQNPGNISITINQVNSSGTPIDVDFALWGPFANLSASCSGLSASNLIDCSYSTSATEVADIPNALSGQFYVLLITNYANQAGTITFQQTGGTATSNCAVICSLTAGNNGPVCAGSTVNLTASAVANATYSWTGPNCFSSNQQNPTNVPVPTTPGTYVYTVTAVTPSGSQCNATTTVTVLAKPNLGADKALTICSGSTANLTTQFVTTGLTPVWTLNGATVANPAAVNVSGPYRLIAANASGCSDTAFLNLTVDTVRATVTAVNANCSNNGTITVSNPSGISPYSYSISTAPTVFQAGNTFPAPQGSYSIIVKDNQGCTSSFPVNVGFTDNLTLTGRLDTTLCRGKSVVLYTNSNATGYTWTPAAGLSSTNSANPVATPTATTTYHLVATLGSCTKTDDVTVTVDESLTVNAGPDVVVLSGETAPIVATTNSQNIVNILWTPPTGLSSTNTLGTFITPQATSGSTPYTITVTNSNGCTASDDVLVTIIPYCVKVRNAFTPNGDGNNELWQVYDDYGCLRNVTVHVFNRYGNKVYENRDYRNNWDGRYNGKSVPDGTYYAVVEFTLITGRVFTYKTDLTIIR